MTTNQLKTITCLAALLISMNVLAGKPGGEVIDVDAVDPSTSEQGKSIRVKVVGNGFESGATVHFLVAGTKDDSQISTSATTFKDGDPDYPGFDTLTADIVILPTAIVTDYEVEVRAGKGRKGKGTVPLFSVRAGGPASKCEMEFEAEFADAVGDGIYSDGEGTYVAWGGTGMRLDTNGSMKLERQNDTRFVYIDFDPNDDGACDGSEPQNPAGATGFCTEKKGVDIRIEHQTQEMPGLCSLDWKDPMLDSMLQAFRINFLGEVGGLLEEVDGNRGNGKPEATPYRLNYGCLNFRYDPVIWADHADDRVLITRLDDYTWVFVGEYACLETQLGNLMVDGLGDPIRVRMPFALTITDVDAPTP